MASLNCPRCGASMPSRRSWAQAAVSTLIAAPAVPDMATQVRCDHCGHVSAASDLRYTAAGHIEPARVVLWVVAAAVVVWALAQLFAR